MSADQMARVSRGADRAVTAAFCDSPRRRRVAFVVMVALVAAHWRPTRRDLELAA